MARVRLTQTELHVPWQEGNIITLQVSSVEGDGEYVCDSLETYPANLKEVHAAAIATREDVIRDLREQLAQHGSPA